MAMASQNIGDFASSLRKGRCPQSPGPVGQARHKETTAQLIGDAAEKRTRPADLRRHRRGKGTSPPRGMDKRQPIYSRDWRGPEGTRENVFEKVVPRRRIQGAALW